MPEHPVDPAIMKAIERFSAHVTIPVLYEHDDESLDQIGTGSLFDLDNRLFLVTASHLFEKKVLDRFAIPTPLTTTVHTLGRHTLHRPDTDAIDLAVLELLEERTVTRAREGWQPLTLANLGNASPDGIFALSGYPSERARKIGGLIGGSLVTAYSERIPIPADATPPVSPAVDLFFGYDLHGTGINGDAITTPALNGTSGCSIWEYCEPQRMLFWTATQSLKMVGVQHAYRHGRYFRGTGTPALLKLFSKIDERLADLVTAHLSREEGPTSN